MADTKAALMNEEGEEVVREKLNYQFVLLKQMDRVGFLASQVDEQASPDTRLRSLSWAVDMFLALLRPYVDRQFTEDVKMAVAASKVQEGSPASRFQLYKTKYEAGIMAMARRGMLLKQGISEELSMDESEVLQ